MAQWIVILSLIFLISGCNQETDERLMQKYILKIENKIFSPLRPLPVICSVNKPAYDAGGLRSPFHSVISNHPQETLSPLQNYPLTALHMMGTVVRGKTIWALIVAPNNLTYFVLPGMFIGDQHGVVKSVSENKVIVLEKISTSMGMHQQVEFINLSCL